jgi:hypothetical protein
MFSAGATVPSFCCLVFKFTLQQVTFNQGNFQSESCTNCLSGIRVCRAEPSDRGCIITEGMDLVRGKVEGLLSSTGITGFICICSLGCG